MNLADLITWIVLSVVISGLIIVNIIVVAKNRKLLNAGIQLSVDKISLLKRVQELSDAKEDKGVEQTEGFLKFVTQSRDWAFEYIEDAQQKLIAFGATLEPLLYEDFLGKEDILIITEAYTELKLILPEEQ